jgi:hypothetical protein
MSTAQPYLQTLSTEGGEAWNRFWFTPSSPYLLARLRIAVGLLAAVYFALWSTHIGQTLSAEGLVPPVTIAEVLRVRSGETRQYHVSPLFFVDSPQVLTAYCAASGLVCLAFASGVLTRVSGMIALLLVLSLVHRAPAFTGPAETLLVYLLLYLVIAPSGAALSIDARRSAGSPQPDWLATVGLRLIQVHTAGFVALLACSMLAAATWWDGTALWNLESQTLSRPVDLAWLRGWPKLMNGWMHLFVLTNALFPVLIWNRLLRPLVLTVAAAMWVLMLPITGQWLYVAAVVVAMCSFWPEQAAADADGKLPVAS